MAASSAAAASSSTAASSTPPAVALIADGLYLGSTACVDSSALAALGVTHLVNVTVDSPQPEGGFESMRVPVKDDLHEPLHEHLEAAAGFIHNAVEPPANGRVCVFCATGKSAAPAVLCYYLMRQRATSLAAALAAVEAAWPGARPNVGFWQRLVEAESWLHGVEQPSISVQQFRWQHIERAFSDKVRPDAQGEERDAQREELLRMLLAAQAEATELLRQKTEWKGAS
jgi:hypothetical protein